MWPDVPGGGGDPVVAVETALADAERALRSGAWVPDDADRDAAGRIGWWMRTAEDPTRYADVLGQVMVDALPSLVTHRDRPYYLWAAAETVRRLATTDVTADVAAWWWGMLGELLHAVVSGDLD